MRLTDSEWKVINLLWKNKPMTLMEITRALYATTGWTKQTVITFLNHMVEKGVVTYAQEGRTKWFSAAMDRTEAELEETTSFLDKVYGGNVGLLISNLKCSDKLTKEQLEELKRIIEED